MVLQRRPLRYDLNFPNLHVGEVSLVYMNQRQIGRRRRIPLIGGGFMVWMLLSCNSWQYDYLGRYLVLLFEFPYLAYVLNFKF